MEQDLFKAVIVKAEVAEELVSKGEILTQESSLYVTGIVQKDERSPFGYELHVKEIEVIHHAVDYPITPKEHGTEFLMDHRHLWLRSRRQHAVMKIRNEIIRATYEFFNENGFVKVDPPILTGVLQKEPLSYLQPNILMKMLIFTKWTIIYGSSSNGIRKSIFIRTYF